MGQEALFTQINQFLLALGCAMPRVLGLMIPIPIFNTALLPGLGRLAIAGGLAVVVAPSLLPSVVAMNLNAGQVTAMLLKEGAVGFVLGMLIAIPFWAFEGIGFFIDNQRGASIAATLNPLTGNDSSPLGILFNQAFIVFFFISGGFTLMLEILYESFRLWHVFTWWPQLRPQSVPVFIHQVMNLVTLALLLSSPAIIAMFLAEVGLALVSRFVPQLQVFFLAMPIKSAVGMLVLMLYIATLFEYAGDHVDQLRGLLPLLGEHWQPSTGGAR